MNYFHDSEKKLHKMQTSQKLLLVYHCQCIIAWIYNCAFHICKTWWMYGYQWNWDTNVY